MRHIFTGVRFSLKKILVPAWKFQHCPAPMAFFLLAKIMGYNSIQIPIKINQLNLDNMPNTPVSYDSHLWLKISHYQSTN